MAISIVPRLGRGSLYFDVDVDVDDALAPAAAWSRAKGHALDLASLSGGGR